MMSDTLLQPTEPFAWAQGPGGPALVCQPLDRVARHVFTTRRWKLGSGRDEDAWREVADAMNVPSSSLIRLRQVHGASVAVRRQGDPMATAGEITPPSLQEADIVVSNDPDVALTVQTADCAPLLIADMQRAVVAAAHAGWRGLASGVPIVAVEALAREFGRRPVDLLVAVGPSIGACCYEVGGEVRARFEQAGFNQASLARWFIREPRPTVGNPSIRGLPAAARPDHWYFDGWAAAREQLESSGVPAGQIYVAGMCTASHEATFCSYRRDGTAAGRMIGAIRCVPPRPSLRSPADRRAR